MTTTTFSWNTASTANWNTATDWNGNVTANGAGNNAFINQGGVTLTSNQTIGNLTVNNGKLFLNSAGQTLTVSNNLTLNGANGVLNINAAATLSTDNLNQVNGTLTMNAGTLTVNTSANFNGGTANFSGGNFNASSAGILVAGGAVTLSGGNFNGTGNFNITSGSFTESGGSLNINSATGTNVGFSGGNFTLSNGSFVTNRNMDISGTANFSESNGTLDVGRALNISGGNFNLSGGNLVVTNNANAGSNFTINGGTFNQSGGTANVGNAVISSGNFLLSNGTFLGNSNAGFNFTVNGGTFNQTGGSATVSNVVVSSGIFSVSGGTFNTTTANFTGGTDTVNNGGTFRTTGTLDIGTNTAHTTLTIGSNGTVIAGGLTTISNSNNAQPSKIAMSGGTLTINNLTFGGTGNLGTVQGFGTINGSGSINNAGTINASGGTLTVSPTINSGVVLAIDSGTAGSDLNIAGTATSAAAIALTSSNQTLEVGSGGNLTISVAETVAGGTLKVDSGATALNITSGLSLSSGAVNIAGGTVTLNGVGGGFNVSGGTFNETGGIVNVGAGNLNVTGGNFNMSGGTLNVVGIGTSNFNNGTANLSGGNLTGGGFLQVTGGTLALSGATLNVGAVTVSKGTFNQSAGTANAGVTTINGGNFNVSGTGVFNTGASNFAVSGGTFNQSGGTINVNFANFSGGNDTIFNGGVNAGGIFNAAGTVTVTGTTLTVGIGGELRASAINIANTGNIHLSSGTVNTSGNITDNGIIFADGSSLITGNLSGNGIVGANGSLNITSNIAASSGINFQIGSVANVSLLEFSGSVGTGDAITYLGTTGGELLLINDLGFAGTIFGLNEGTSNTAPTTFIDIFGANVSVTGGGTGNAANGTLTLSDGATLKLSNIANLSGTWFANWKSDGSGGTEIFLSNVVCYAAGTLILTPRGEVAVEDLSPSDMVMTLVDGEQLARPVKWLGRRRIDLGTHPRPETVTPIRIGVDAFGPGMPQRDLYLSPDHAVFVDGVLVCARQLVNGTTIRRETGWRSVDYYHVELDQHSVILAEGLPAESYLNTGNKGFFQNSGEPLQLHPDLTGEADLPLREAGSCVPFVSDEANVRPIWQRLADRAAALGQQAPSVDTTTNPKLRLIANGRTVRPIYGENGLYIFALARGLREARLISRANPPGDAVPWSPDPRRLGVCVARLVLRGSSELQNIPVDHPDLSVGWWASERNGTVLARWTDGNAVLPLPPFAGPAMLEVHLHGEMTYVNPRPADIEDQARPQVA